MRALLLFLFALFATPALAGAPMIWYGTNSKDLSTAGLITPALTLPNGTYSAKIVAPTLTASETFTLPTTTGIVGQVLQTNGTGTLSWQSPTSNVFRVQPMTALTAIGGANPGLGHILTQSDFSTAMTSTQYALYNLAANGNDGGPQAITLTANGTPTYTTTNILGTANAAATLNGTSQYYSSTNAFFNPGSSKSYSVGGWVKMTSWTPAAQMQIFTNEASASDFGFLIYVLTDGSINFAATNTATTYDANIGIPSPGFAAGSWHHIAMVYDYSVYTLRAYIDGKLAGAPVSLANQRAVTSSIFEIGARRTTAANFLAGSVEDVFFTNGYAPTVDDIRKLAARRLDHNSAIAQDAQTWSAFYQRADQAVAPPIGSSWIVDKNSNSLYYDASDFPVGSFFGFKGQSLASSPMNVSQFSYDSTYLSTAPPTTIAHGLGAIPDNAKVQYTTGYGASGAVQTYDAGVYCSADATNFYCDWSGLTVSATNTVRLTAWMNGVQTAVAAASAGNSGIVNTTAQTFAGAKTFVGGIVGSTSGSAPGSGLIGEEAFGPSNKTTGGFTSVGSSGTWNATRSISLTGGHWLIWCQMQLKAADNSTIFTTSASEDFDISATSASGNGVYGGQAGLDYQSLYANNASNSPAYISGGTVMVFVAPTSTTTYYCNLNVTYSGTAPLYRSGLQAVRLP